MSRIILFGLASTLVAGCTSKDDSGASKSENHAPVANAGADITQTGDSPVALDGLGSFDQDGDPLSFSWSFEHVPETSTVDDRTAPFTSNNSGDAGTTSFVPDVTGTYVVELVVNDGRLYSEPDYVVVIITEPDDLPVADAGDDHIIKLGASVTLDGTGSYDPNGHELTYAWSLVDLPAASRLDSESISGGNTDTGSFTPDVTGVYVANLVVSSGLANSLPDAAIVTVTGENGPPTANAGKDFTADDCSAITLDASLSADPDGDALTYFWELQSKPADSETSNLTFADRTAVTTTFYADVDGTYVFSVAVSDGTYWSVPDLTTGTVTDRKWNTEPTVEAGLDKAFDGGYGECAEVGYGYECDECGAVTATLGDEAFITDADSDPYDFEWSVIDGTATIDDPYALVTLVTLEGAAPVEPGACENNDYTFQLQATDCPGAVTNDTVIFTVTCCGTKEK